MKRLKAMDPTNWLCSRWPTASPSASTCLKRKERVWSTGVQVNSTQLDRTGLVSIAIPNPQKVEVKKKRPCHTRVLARHGSLPLTLL